jgi:hypothetical protein
MPTNQHAVVGRRLGPKVLDICIPWIGSAHDLPVCDNCIGTFNDCARPAKFCGSPYVQPARVKGDAP